MPDSAAVHALGIKDAICVNQAADGGGDNEIMTT
jgi:hypothetical protein